MLNEIDGIQNSEGVFVVGCSNQPLESIDAAMLRPGRLEVHIELGLPSFDTRCAISVGCFSTITRGCDAEGEDIHFCVAEATNGETAAHIHKLYHDALVISWKRNSTSLSLTPADVKASLAARKPSTPQVSILCIAVS